MLRRAAACLFLVLFAAGCAAARPGAAMSSGVRSESRRAHASAVVTASAGALRELRGTTRDRVLDYALEDARAVVILPGVYRAGFLYSLRGGDGVLVARRPDGRWSGPAFVSLLGAGFGYQAGFEKARCVLVIENEALLARLLKCGLSLDASAGFDVLGARQVTAAPFLPAEAPAQVFSDGSGVIAGVSVHGGWLRINSGLTAAYYGRASGNAAYVLAAADAPDMATFALWGALVENPPDPRTSIFSHPAGRSRR